MSMVSQKVVLSGPFDGGPDEVELGPFAHGVVFEHPGSDIIDVATGSRIARGGGGWCRSEPGPIFKRVFVQTYASDTPHHPISTEHSLARACLGRRISVHVSEALEHRLRAHAEEIDADFRRAEMEPLDRLESGAIDDECVSHVLLAAAELGLESWEAAAGVEARLDGTIVPAMAKQHDSLDPASWAGMLLRRDDQEGMSSLQRLLDWYEQEDGQRDDLGELLIVKDARAALEARR